jgi:hypothetical protein
MCARLLCILVLLVASLFGASGAIAAPNNSNVTILITATVTDVDDLGNLLGGQIKVGDTITGSYTYDLDTPDGDPSPSIGDYWHFVPPAGVLLVVNGIEFRSDPVNTVFQVQLQDNSNGADTYAMDSWLNLPLQSLVMVDRISWQLNDPTMTALSNDDLLATAPDLTKWQSSPGLSITGFSVVRPDSFTISAQVVSAEREGGSPPVEVLVDVHPRSDTNPVNVGEGGVIPVAVLSTPDFDATTVDPLSVQFGPSGASEIHGKGHFEDVDRDRDRDLLLHFDVGESGIGCDDSFAELVGATYDGDRIHGGDSITVLGCPTEITILLTAQVAMVQDSHNLLGGQIQIGDTITGRYTYNRRTPDSNPAPEIGIYNYYSLPYGVFLEANGLVFQTDPSQVEFSIGVNNNYNSLDNYGLQSNNNLSLSNGALVDYITWQLDDPSMTALFDDSLPGGAPDLGAWQSWFGLTIDGCLPDPSIPIVTCVGSRASFVIRAHVTAAEVAE